MTSTLASPSDLLQLGDDFNGCKVVGINDHLIIFNKRNGLCLPMPRMIIDALALHVLEAEPDWDVGKTNGDELAARGFRMETYFITGYKTIHRQIIKLIVERHTAETEPRVGDLVLIATNPAGDKLGKITDTAASQSNCYAVTLEDGHKVIAAREHIVENYGS